MMTVCCFALNTYLKDDDFSLEYLPVTRRYVLRTFYISAVDSIFYCPWCGQKLPKNLKTEYHELLQEYYGNIYPEIDIKNNPEIADEFKSDAWWRKRGL